LLAVDVDTTDPVVLAGRVKRSLGSEARKREKISDTELGKATAAREAVGNTDTTQPSDETELRANHTKAVEHFSALCEKRRAFEDQARARDVAKQKLDLAASGYNGPTPDEAAATIERTKIDLNNAIDLADQAEKAAQVARQNLAEAKAAHNTATASLKSSEDHFRNLESWRETLGTVLSDGPTDEQIAIAKAQVDQESAAIEIGVRIRDAKRQMEVANEHEKAAREQRMAAEALRGAAKSTDEVLSRLIPAGPLRVEGGRLVCATDRSNSELYSDLSDGERWRIAIDIAADQLPPHGLLVIPQPAYEGLTESSRQAIHAHARERRVVILTAEAVDGPLTAVPFNEAERASRAAG
jgi:hypothetical protein